MRQKKNQSDDQINKLSPYSSEVINTIQIQKIKENNIFSDHQTEVMQMNFKLFPKQINENHKKMFCITE